MKLTAQSVFHKNVFFEQYLGKLGKVERVGKTVEIKYDDGAILGFHADAVKKVQWLHLSFLIIQNSQGEGEGEGRHIFPT